MRCEVGVGGECWTVHSGRQKVIVTRDKMHRWRMSNSGLGRAMLERDLVTDKSEL